MESGQAPEHAPHWMHDDTRSHPGSFRTRSDHCGSASRWYFIVLPNWIMTIPPGRPSASPLVAVPSLPVLAIALHHFLHQAALPEVDLALQAHILGIDAL